MSSDVARSRYQQVAAALRSGSFELFTCDVFDTLVWRPTAQPTDLFVELGRRLLAGGLLPEGTDPVEFSGMRQWAEADARRRLWKKSATRECTIDGIWEAMPAALTAGHDRDAYIEAELACEGANLSVHPDTAELLALASSSSVATALVSDTYFSPDQLNRLLRAAGFDPDSIGSIATSSDARIGKADGLLAKVAADAGVAPERVLHFGDNVLSDLAAAAESGAVGMLAEVDADRRAVSRPSPAVVAYADRNGGDGALTAAVRETLVAAATADSAAYQFGAAVVGPALAGFSSWASAQAQELGAPTIHCLLREGVVIADLMHRTRPDGPATRLVHASRWALLRAAVFDGTADELFPVIERRTLFRPEQLAAAFDLSIDDVRRVLPHESYHHDHRFDAVAAVAADPTLREQIVDASQRQRRSVLAYLRRTLDLDNGPLVLCDIGWGGKIQATIDTILRSDGYEGEVVGLYLMLSETGVNRRRNGARMLSYLPETDSSELVGASADVVQHHAAILERVATPEIGTLLGFTDDGEPICRPDDDDRQAASLHLARQGVYDVTDRLARMAQLDGPIWRDRSFRTALLDTIATTIAEPTAALAHELGEWHHDDLAGDDRESLVAGDVAGLVRFLNAADAGAIGWEEVFWLPGAAAGANPVLSAQLATARLGVDLSTITPISDAGMARIASFPVGSDLASHQIEVVPRQSPDGWQLLRLHASVPSVRSLRLDAGSEACLVQLGHLTVQVTAADGSIDLVTGGFAHGSLRWIDGRAFSASIAAFAPGGHLLIDIDETTASTVTRVDVDWAFRTWRLAAEESNLARPSVAQRARSSAQRAVRAARRRTRGGAG